MCGLVGVAGDLRHADVQAFKQMLIADTFRGAHSTGVAGVGANKDVEPDVLKAPMPSWDFLSMLKDVDSVINVQQQILMGHNRHATQGEITRQNAHPFFVEDQLVGCHNGTLLAHATKTFVKDFDTYGTDSEAALASFVKRGTVETLTNIMGAWAFVWFDYRNNTLNFTRNKERPLFFAYEPEKRGKIYWASELDMLKWVLGRNGLITKDMKFLDVGENQHVYFEVPDNLRSAFGEMRVDKYKPKERPATTGTWGQNKYRGGTKTETKKSAGHVSTKQDSEEVVDLNRYLQIKTIRGILQPEHWNGTPEDWVPVDHRGSIIADPAELCTYVRGKSCACCGASIRSDERFRSVAKDCFICEDCAENDSTLAEMLYEAGVMA